jgi:hypothetical protein
MNYGAFVRDAAPASARHRTTTTPSLDLRKVAPRHRPGGHSLAAHRPVRRQHIAVLEAALRAAELHRSIVKHVDAYV